MRFCRQTRRPTLLLTQLRFTQSASGQHHTPKQQHPKRHHCLPAGTTTVRPGDLPASTRRRYGSPDSPQFCKFCFATVVTETGNLRRYRCTVFMFLPNFSHQLAGRIADDRHDRTQPSNARPTLAGPKSGLNCGRLPNACRKTNL